MASYTSLRTCYTETVRCSAQQNHVQSQIGAAENQDTHGHSSSALCLKVWLSAYSIAIFCDLAEAQLSHRGTLCTHSKCNEAQLIQCHTHVLAAPVMPSTVGRGVCDAASEGALFPQLPEWSAGGQGGRKGKRRRSKTQSPDFNSLSFVGNTVRCPDLANSKFR